MKTMISNICLVVIFNHRYNSNVEKLQKIYGSRFSNIYYVVPFQTKGIPDYLLDKVIRVYESSFYFQGYISYAYDVLKDQGYGYFMFIGDDLILNPRINENNLFEITGIDQNSCFIKRYEPVDLGGSISAIRLYDTIKPFYFASGMEWKRELPSKEEALLILSEHGYDESVLHMTWDFVKRNRFLKSFKMLPFSILVFILTKFKRYPYPLFNGYADIVCVPANVMPKFAYYCGVLSAMNIFVEIAIPTALLFSSKKVCQESDIRLRGGDVWSLEEIAGIEKQYHSNMKELLEKFPDYILYYHPVKLSKWKWNIDET